MLQLLCVASLLRTGLGQGTCENTPHSYCVAASTDESHNADSVSLLQTSMRTSQGTKLHEHACFDASAWFAKWQASPWKQKKQQYSQGGQDAVLASLFDDAHLGTTNKFYVEFGYNWVGGNTDRLEKDFGWTNGLRMDGAAHPVVPGMDKASNLIQQWITPETITSIFQKHEVPTSPDYVSIDIDSCDLWVFLNMTAAYTPRVITVEYNSNYGFEESRTNICKKNNGDTYSWQNDRAYGASFAALNLAAKMRKYTPVWVETKLDVFLVRNDLICPGKEVDLKDLKKYVPFTCESYTDDSQKVAEWTMPFTVDMVQS